MKKAVILGTFDGLHIGHQAVIEKAIGYDSTALVFAAPPKACITQNYELLSMPKDKENQLLMLGVKRVDALDFDSVRSLSPDEFTKIIKEKYNPDLISCGFNYRYGKGAAGNTETLREFCSKNGIELAVTNAIQIMGQAASSTMLREFIKSGEVERANQYMYSPFGFTAPIVHGDKRGRELGFPTANQEYPEILAKLKFGVYKTEIIINDKCYKGVTNVGIRPTFKTDNVGCETYISDFSGELYGKALRINFLSFMRAERKFSGIDELKDAIKNDALQAFR